MKENKVSVIVPVYHVEKYLRPCVESILKQSYENIELILVDDGGDDGCPALCDSYAGRDPRVKCLHKKNEGQSFARREGLKAASGQYILFVDADDWIEPETVEITLKAALAYDADVVGFNYKRYYEKKVFPTAVFEGEHIWRGKEVNYIQRRIVGLLNQELSRVEEADRPTTMWGKLYKKTVAETGKFVSERETGSMEDGIFNLYALENCQVYVHLNQYFYCYRKTNDSASTRKYRRNLFQQWNHLYDLLEDFMKKKTSDAAEYSEALSNRIVVSMIGLGWNEIASKKSFMKKSAALAEILNSPRWKKAYGSLKLHDFRWKWRVFFGLAKYRMVHLLMLMLILIEKMRRVKES